MPKVTVSALLVAAFAVGCAAATVGSRFVVPPARAGTSPTRWEYRCLRVDGVSITEAANKYGAEGWEMVAGTSVRWSRGVVQEDATTTWCFKRALP